jgi:purine-binding chemotaxis protein CheW
MNALQPYDAPGAPAISGQEPRQYVTLRLGGQLFGIPVMQVQDMLRWQKVARVPLAPPEIAGLLNLRGRIVTAVDLRLRLGLAPYEDPQKTMSVVVDHRGELFSLIVDAAGEVMSLPPGQFEKTPTNLAPAWRDVAEGIYKLADELLIIIDVSRILRIT